MSDSLEPVRVGQSYSDDYLHYFQIRRGGDTVALIVNDEEPLACVMAAAPELLRAAQGAWHLCESLLAVREGATDELIAGCRDALAAAIKNARPERLP